MKKTLEQVDLELVRTYGELAIAKLKAEAVPGFEFPPKKLDQMSFIRTSTRLTNEELLKLFEELITRT